MLIEIEYGEKSFSKLMDEFAAKIIITTLRETRTAKEACEVLKLERNTLQNWIKRLKIRKTRYGH